MPEVAQPIRNTLHYTIILSLFSIGFWHPEAKEFLWTAWVRLDSSTFPLVFGRDPVEAKEFPWTRSVGNDTGLMRIHDLIFRESDAHNRFYRCVIRVSDDATFSNPKIESRVQGRSCISLSHVHAFRMCTGRPYPRSFIHICKLLKKYSVFINSRMGCNYSSAKLNAWKGANKILQKHT